MRDFLQRLSVFVSAFAILLVAAPTSDIGNGYLTAYKSHRQPREIQFIGGSNLCFGLKSNVLDDYISNRYASYGFHGATGLDFHLQQLSLFSESTTIFSPPLEWIDNNSEPHLRAEVLSFFPFSLTSLAPVKLIPDVICARTTNVLRLIKTRKLDEPRQEKSKPAVFEWTNSIIDENGLIHAGLRPNNLAHPKKLYLPSSIDNHSWTRAKNKIDFILPPPIAESNRNKTEYLSKIFRELRTEIGAKLLLTVESCVLPDSLFGDDQYHLNEIGASRYSEMVGKAIRHQETNLPIHAIQQP